MKAHVTLFKPGGKFYTEEEWEIPTVDQVTAAGGNIGDSMIPYCMRFSPDFRRISGGPVLIDTQEPWGYPHLIPSQIVLTEEVLREAVELLKGGTSNSLDPSVRKEWGEVRDYVVKRAGVILP